MARYRKKPVVVDAWRNEARSPIPAWLQGNGTGNAGSEINILTLEGVMLARPGDWIVRGVKGELYPVKPDIFWATYEPVDDPATVAKTMEASMAGNGMGSIFADDLARVYKDGFEIGVLAMRHDVAKWLHDNNHPGLSAVILTLPSPSLEAIQADARAQRGDQPDSDPQIPNSATSGA